MANKVMSIYVGNDAIRIAEMQKNSNKTVILSNAAEIATPDNSINDGYLVDITAISEAIRQAVFGRGFTAKEVIFTVQSKKIASKDVVVPYIKKPSKMQSVLQANSGEYFPMSNPNDYSFAFTYLEDFTNEQGHMCRISAVAAPNDLIQCYQELARELRYTVKSIDYFGNSIIQLLQMQMTEGRVDMVLQIEKDSTYVNIMRGKTLILQRNVPYGKNAVINALMDVKKISEKDAKTLLSNETLLDQHVTSDEYAQTVQYLVSGIGRVVEYHRTKNINDTLQGIKIFGEGSAIAGIEKILERELGAPVQHFETLSGVSIRGQASLTAEEVLRYLPNIGAVIEPMNITIKSSRNSGARVSSETTMKILIGILIVDFIVMATWSTIVWVKNSNAKKEQARLQAEIDAIKDIEEIAKQFELSFAKLNVVKEFLRSTKSNNEMLPRLIDDLEAKLPTECYISSLKANEGFVEMTAKTGWHAKNKNEVADILMQLKDIDYISASSIPNVTESYKVVFIKGYDAENNPEFVYEEATEEEKELGKEHGDYVFVAQDDEIPEEYQDYEQMILVQSEFTINCSINRTPTEDEMDELPDPTLSGGAVAPADTTQTTGGEN